MTEPDLQPDTGDLLQEEQVPGLTAIPVVVEGPTRVVELPAQDLVLGQVDVDNTTPVRIFGRDPRRKRLQLVASGGSVRIATSQKQAVPGNGAVWPVGVPYMVNAMTEVWVIAVSGSPVTVSYSAEQWAD